MVVLLIIESNDCLHCAWQEDGVCGGGDIGKPLPPPSPWRGY